MNVDQCKNKSLFTGTSLRVVISGKQEWEKVKWYREERQGNMMVFY